MKPIISVKNVYKKFIIPHEKENSLKRTLLSIWKKKTYEEFYALKDISFDIFPGEFVGIIGRNGSGKSTLLKILAGIYSPDTGNVIINGKISPFLELGVGFNGELSGRDNVYLYGAVLGLTKKQIDSKFNEIVEFAELSKFIDMKMKNYSSGMYVRLAFSVAIQADAPILLVDEVLAVGDANFQSKCFNVFERYKKEGKTVILVTHDLSAVEKWCDKAILIDEGIIKKDGKPEEILNKYKEKLEKKKIISEKEKEEQLFVQKKFEDEINQLKNQIKTSKKQVKENISKKRIGNKVISITDTKIEQLFNKVIIHCNYTNKSNSNKAIIGLILKNEKGEILYGINSKSLNKDIILNKNGNIDISFNIKNININKIYISIGIRNLNYEPYDILENFACIELSNKNKFIGDFNTEADIDTK